MKKVFIFSLLLVSLTSCYAQKRKGRLNETTTPTITQGVCGTVIWKEGNLMPGPERPIPQGREIVREVWIYERTNASQVVSDGGFYRDIRTKLVKKTTSDAKGKFCVTLAPGTYSLFVKEADKGLYANSFDENNDILPITVQPGKVANVTITIDYKAAY